MREKGTNRSKFFRGQIDKYTWVEKGSSYLPSEMNAAYLYAQLEECEKINHKRHEIYDYYHANLKNLEDEGKIQRPFVPEGCVHNAHMYYIKTRDLSVRSRLIAYLKGSHPVSVLPQEFRHTPRIAAGIESAIILL